MEALGVEQCLCPWAQPAASAQVSCGSCCHGSVHGAAGLPRPELTFLWSGLFPCPVREYVPALPS